MSELKIENLFIEALIIGISTIVLGLIVKYFIELLFKPHYLLTFVLILFLTGFLIHIICQITGINKWYCKNGYACKI